MQVSPIPGVNFGIIRVWHAFGDHEMCGRIEEQVFFPLFFTWSVFLPRCPSIPCSHYLLALRLLRSLARKEHCACPYFPRSPPLLVLCVAPLLLAFIVAINADWLICPVPDNRCVSCSQCGNFSAMSPLVHEKSLRSVYPFCGPLGACDGTTLPDGPAKRPSMK